MFDRREPLDFLKRMTFFMRVARSTPDTYENLVDQFEKVKENQTLAATVAQKLSAHYGLSGLYLYIPMKLQLLQTAKTVEHEIIGQELLQLLSLVLYMEKFESNSAEEAWINAQKETCENLCNAGEKTDVLNEARDLANHYFSLGATP